MEGLESSRFSIYYFDVVDEMINIHQWRDYVTSDCRSLLKNVLSSQRRVFFLQIAKSYT